MLPSACAPEPFPATRPRSSSSTSSHPCEAVDTYAVTGGVPALVAAARGQGLAEFVEASRADPSSRLVQMGRLSLAAEFPAASRATQLLETIGAGQRTTADISRDSGIGSSNLAPLLKVLREEKRVVATETIEGSRSDALRQVDVGVGKAALRTVEIRSMQPFVPLPSTLAAEVRTRGPGLEAAPQRCCRGRPRRASPPQRCTAGGRRAGRPRCGRCCARGRPGASQDRARCCG